MNSFLRRIAASSSAASLHQSRRSALCASLSSAPSAAAKVGYAPPRRHNDDPSLRVVSYNVLSSNLSLPDHFNTSDPDHLDPSNRLGKVLTKLEERMEGEGDGATSTAPNTVYCLQEVSRSWAGELQTFFAERNYQLVTGLYGRKFNGYMGVAVAYPMERFETLQVDIARLSDHRDWPSEEDQGGRLDQCGDSAGVASSASGLVRAWGRGIDQYIVGPVRRVLRLPRPSPDPWTMAENRHNVLVFVRLGERWDGTGAQPQDGDGDGDGDSSVLRGRTFCVANYHMPCAYYAPRVMTLHADMAARRVQDLAGTDPYILAGDFNFTPDSPTYGLMTTGALPEDDPTYPKEKFGVKWCASIEGMRSAYAVSDVGEPDFTNYAQTKDQDEPFIGTLDYIFLSKEWRVDGVKSIPHRDKAGGPFPTVNEPSDHVVIAADLRLGGGDDASDDI